MKEININEIEGFRIGHATNTEGGTGCSVIICEEGACTGLSVMGAAPASRETELLKPLMDCKAVHAVTLTGGSAYGLAAADGVIKYLEEKEIGFDVGMGVVPITPASAIFDLIVGDFKARPTKEMGYAACVDSENNNPGCGNVGVGTGATVGKFKGAEQCMKTGVGTYAVQIGDLKIGAIVAVNALGDIFDADSGKQIAGMVNKDHTAFEKSCEAMWDSVQQDVNVFSGNTTIGCVITNANLRKDQCCKLAEMTHDGYARVIKPVHTTADGDSIYFMAHGDVEVYQDALGDLSAYVMSKAINEAVNSAESAYGFKTAADLGLV